MRLFLALAPLYLAFSGPAGVTAVQGGYSPSGSVKDPLTKIAWHIRATAGGKIATVQMSLNGEPVMARYNDDDQIVEYVPANRLKDGFYKVTCKATIPGVVTARQDWSFEISAGSAPAGSYAASNACDALNAIRKELCLPAMKWDGRMASAALAHSKYQVLNAEPGHTEEPGKPGFTGKAPWDRTLAFGFPRLCYECACSDEVDPARAVRLLFDAPYHRIPFLQPGTPEVGVGMEREALTIDYAVSKAEGSGISPGPDQQNVPLSWDGNESPSPLRLHTSRGLVGYPIVFAYFSPRLERISVASIRLTDDQGAEVPCYLNTPENDGQLTFGAILIPKSPLLAGREYSVEAKATTLKGEPVGRSWKFTTAH